MINLLKQALETVLNHKQMGKLSPSDFNTSLAKNIWNIYVNIFADMRKLSYRKMRFRDTPNYGGETQIWSLCVYNGKLYGGTYPNGKLYEWNGVNAWVEKAPKLGGTQICSLCVYNGRLYGGTAGNGTLYEWNAILKP